MAKFSGRLGKAPIAYALCQIKFPTIGPLDETKIEAVHGPLRLDYPHRLSQDATEFSIVAGSDKPPMITNTRVWPLYDRKKTSGFIVDSTAIVYRTAVYRDFEYFVDQTMRGVSAVLDALKPPVIDRIGLRFVDLIQANADEKLAQYIVEPLYGFIPDVPGFQPQSMQQLIRGMTEHGLLLFRYSRGRHVAAVPADLIDPTLSMTRMPKPDLESVIIDIDHFRENADLDPDPQLIRQVILDLQGPMSTLFKDAVTDYAIGQWKAP